MIMNLFMHVTLLTLVFLHLYLVQYRDSVIIFIEFGVYIIHHD